MHLLTQSQYFKYTNFIFTSQCTELRMLCESIHCAPAEKQNSLKTVTIKTALKLFCFSFISLCGHFKKLCMKCANNTNARHHYGSHERSL